MIEMMNRDANRFKNREQHGDLKKKNLPEKVLLDEILRPSSLRHLTAGGGDPRAWHTKLWSLPSRTITSELLSPSSMVGGTAFLAADGIRNQGSFRP